jgi:hypothetical protein
MKLTPVLNFQSRGRQVQQGQGLEGADRVCPMAERRPAEQRQRRPVHEQSQVPRLPAGRPAQGRLHPRPELDDRLEDADSGHPGKTECYWLRLSEQQFIS